MNGFRTIMGKEFARVFKDKKLIFSMFILPVIIMAGIFLLMFGLISNMKADIDKHISEVYVQDAPQDFADTVKQAGDINVTFIGKDADINAIKDKILSADADLLVVFPDNFTDDVQNYENASVPQIKTFYNPSEDYSSEARTRFVGTYIESYRQALLTERYGSIDKTLAFTVDSDNPESEIVDSNKATGKMLGTFVPYFITMMIFAGAMSFGVDSIAGEKERGTLASLLLTPVKRVHIVMGKLVALGVLSVMSAVVYLVGMLVALPIGMKQLGTSDVLSGLSISFTGTQVVEFIIIIIGIVLMYVSIIGMVSVLSKNIKEAQTYIMPVYMIVIVVGMITMYTSDTDSMTSYLIPVFNSSAAFRGILTGEITTAEFAVAAIVTYAFAGILIALTAKAFKSEKLMFNA
mgnify:FL=1|jgi:sodium transport system permease protein